MTDVTNETAVSITLNGRTIEARQGELLIDAAERNGVYIPRFCYHPRMEPVGMCRMCIVEVDSGRGPALQPSCMLSVTPDMVVETESEVTKKAQDGVLEFLLINHPLDCPVCDKGGECPLQDHTISFGPGESRFVEEKRHYEKPIPISDLVLLDRERCILCDRCTRFAKDVAGDPLIHFQDRGNGTQVNTFPDHPFASYYSGNTVQICPVGALTAEPYRFKARPWDLNVVESTCTSCSMGCRMVIDSSRNEVLRYVGVDSDPVNWGWMCDRGRFGHDAIGSPDRLTNPVVKKGQAFEEVRWGDALSAAAKAIKAGLDRSGPSGTAVIGGARLTNEAAYAWTKLAKGTIGTDSVDAQLGDGLPADVVAGLPRATIDEVCSGRPVVLLGVDPKDELAVLFLRLRDAVTRGQASLVELATHETSISALAAHSLRYAPGEAHDLVSSILDGGDHSEVADLLAKGPFTVVLGRGSVAEGPESFVAAAAALLAAHPATTFLPALRRGNVNGAIDMGMAPGLLPGRVDLDAGREWFSDRWSTTPEGAGLDTAQILEAAAEGRIDTLVLVGADPLSDFPDRDLAARGLAGARTVISVDTFLNDSAAKADVVLPAASFAEVSGTTTNLEGRVTKLEQKVTAIGSARPDWMIAAELAFRLGADLGFESVEEIWAEIEQVSGIHRGITLETLSTTSDGVVAGSNEVAAAALDPQPEPADDESGDDVEDAAPSVDEETEDSSDDSVDAEQDEPLVEAAVAPEPVSFDPSQHRHATTPTDAYSLRLVTNRRLFDHGTLVANAAAISGLADDSTARANPRALDRLGVTSNGRVKISSARGSLTTALVGDSTVPEGVVVVDWNLGDPDPTVLIDASAAVTEVRVETTS